MCTSGIKLGICGFGLTELEARISFQFEREESPASLGSAHSRQLVRQCEIDENIGMAFDMIKILCKQGV